MALFGGMAPLIREDLEFDAWWIGFGIAIAFIAAAAASVVSGRLADRLGSQRALLLGLLISAASLSGMAFVAHDRVTLSIFLALGGVSNAIIQPAANLALALGVPIGRQGFAFGIKQAAIPAAAGLGGFAVPVIGIPLGWRTAFIAGMVLALLTAVLPAPTRSVSRHTRSKYQAFSVPRSLWLITAGVALASAAANAMTAYLVESAIAGGWEAGQAGLFLGAGSVLGIVSRLVVGWTSDKMTDKMTADRLRLVIAMMLAGAAGFASLAFIGSPVFLALGVSLGFAAGWGHNGLILYAITRLHPEAPAAATGVAQAGSFIGPVLGPPLFGVIATTWSYGAAWTTLGLLSATAGLLVILALRQIERERPAR